MSEPTYPEYSAAFVDQLINLDTEMATRMTDNAKNTGEIYQIYLSRLSLFERSSLFPLTERDKMLLNDKKEDLYIALKLFISRFNMIKQ